MAEAFERVLLDAAYCDLAIEDEEDLEEDNNEKMDVDWDTDCEHRNSQLNFDHRIRGQAHTSRTGISE
ncbi:hypothetical protein Y032_0290g1551 [Ancylostoma ceylanicum]|uniref:Uncharacterized protein n=1 Tax=Ancylostoma ceylanicum TaxID=53326 RepID=A0A016S5S4_9BILA|nr:hypothetical protein Y032_0290g1551 [Ancylostoma ceylanicum]